MKSRLSGGEWARSPKAQGLWQVAEVSWGLQYPKGPSSPYLWVFDTKQALKSSLREYLDPLGYASSTSTCVCMYVCIHASMLRQAF